MKKKKEEIVFVVICEDGSSRNIMFTSFFVRFSVNNQKKNNNKIRNFFAIHTTINFGNFSNVWQQPIVKQWTNNCAFLRRFVSKHILSISVNLLIFVCLHAIVTHFSIKSTRLYVYIKKKQKWKKQNWWNLY